MEIPVPEVTFQPDNYQPDNPLPLNLYNQDGGRKRRLVFYLLAFVLLIIVLWFLWREFSYIYSLRATVMGELANYKAPDAGHITKIYVKDGQKISKGDLLFGIETVFYEKKLHQLRKQASAAQSEIAQAEKSLAFEEDKRKAFIEANERKLQQLQINKKAAQGQLDLSKTIYDRHNKLYETSKAIALEEVQVRKTTFDQHLILRKQLEDQINLQEFMIDQAKKGRYLTVTNEFRNSDPATSIQGVGSFGYSASFGIMEIKDERPALLVSLAEKKTNLELINSQIADVEIWIDKCKVHSRVDGVVNHISRREGDYVTNNDYILSIELNGSEQYIAARFTTDDAKFLQHEETCKIIVPSSGVVTEGKVVSVGHSGLNAIGVVSVDDETALAETPVKIEFPQDVKVRTGQHVFVKVHRGWTFRTWLLRLF